MIQIYFYTILKNNCHELLKTIQECIITITNMKHSDKVDFINNNVIPFINKFDENQEDLLKAAYFYILNKISFSYIKYTNKGLLRIDINKHKLFNLKINTKRLLEFSKFLNTIILIKHNFITNGYNIIDKYVNNESFVYIDPPYDTDMDEYTNYGTCFNRNHQDEILRFVNKLTSKKIKCLISNRNTDYIKFLYSKYNMTELDIPCFINNINTSTMEFRKEVLIYNH